VGVDESPVPPPPTPNVPESVGAKVKAPPELVIPREAVRPLNAVEDVANVIAPVCAEPYVCASERRPVFEMVTLPVAPETLIPVPAMFERTPVLVTLPAEYVRPDEKVVVAALYTTPLLIPKIPVYADAFTPVPPWEVESVPLMVERVEVATHDGMPFCTASTCPPDPMPKRDKTLVADA